MVPYGSQRRRRRRRRPRHIHRRTMSFALPITTAQMDEANRAMCYALWNRPAGTKPSFLKAIAGHVVKTDGTHASIGGVLAAAMQFKEEKAKRGRTKRDKKTAAAEDREILSAFKFLRPPAHGIDSRPLHRALQILLRRNTSCPTVTRRFKRTKKHNPSGGSRRRTGSGRRSNKSSALPHQLVKNSPSSSGNLGPRVVGG